jgi:hypothetical protein
MKSSVQILLFGMLIILAGCVTLYKPNAINSPLLKEKGELSSTAALGLSGSGLFNLQAAYAISNHTGVMIDGMYHRHVNRADSSVEKLNMFFGEAGAGYFTTFGNKSSGLFQCYGGAGYGFTSDIIRNPGSPYPEVSSEYSNLFIQPGLAFTSQYFTVAFDLRANYVHLFNIHAYLYDKFEFWNTQYIYYSDRTLNFMNLEPTVTLKAGGDKMKGFVQLGVTVPTINSDSYFDVNTSSMLLVPLFKFNVGINYTIGRH